MKFFYLLSGGILISTVHFYLVLHHRKNRKYSISEHAIIDRESRLLYFAAHVICEVLFLLYSYQFFIIEHSLVIAFYLNVSFAVFDFAQAILPSGGKTEKLHFTAAYVSWVSYLVSGLIALIQLQISEPYKLFAILLLFPILGMFMYMYINRSKLYPYQLLIVTLYVIYMLLITIGAT